MQMRPAVQFWKKPVLWCEKSWTGAWNGLDNRWKQKQLPSLSAVKDNSWWWGLKFEGHSQVLIQSLKRAPFAVFTMTSFSRRRLRNFKIKPKFMSKRSIISRKFRGWQQWKIPLFYQREFIRTLITPHLSCMSSLLAKMQIDWYLNRYLFVQSGRPFPRAWNKKE